jgi:hypothetical protein
MRFLAMYTPDKSRAGVPPTKDHMEQMGRFVDEMMKSGALIMTGGLLPASQGLRVKSSGGKITVTDGPFSEAKEVVAGFAILEARSKEDLIEMSKRFLKVAGDGESELRQIMDAPPEAR